MNSKTRFQNAFNGREIDRLSMWYGAEPDLTDKIMNLIQASDYEEMLKMLQVDFRTVRPKYIGPELKRYEDGTFDTVWGIRRGGGFWGTALNSPLSKIETIQELNDYPFPKAEWYDVDFTKEEMELSRDYAIIGGEWAPFWHEALELVGMEKMLVDLYLNPTFATALLEKCLELHLEINEKAFKKNAKYIDIYWFANDFGTTNGLIMDPKVWRTYLKPMQAELAAQGKKYGLKIAMHSCGDITEIIPDLIDIGIEILNPIQVSCPNMRPEYLKKEYGKDLMFFGAIDYNELLTNGSPMDVEQGVKDMIDRLGADGRYIVAPSHDLLMGEVPAENMVTLYRTAAEYSGREKK